MNASSIMDHGENWCMNDGTHIQKLLFVCLAAFMYSRQDVDTAERVEMSPKSCQQPGGIANALR